MDSICSLSLNVDLLYHTAAAGLTVDHIAGLNIECGFNILQCRTACRFNIPQNSAECGFNIKQYKPDFILFTSFLQTTPVSSEGA